MRRPLRTLLRRAREILGHDETEQLIRIAEWRASKEWRETRGASLRSLSLAYVATDVSNALAAERRARGYIERYGHEPQPESVSPEAHVDALRRLRTVRSVAPTLVELGQGWLLRELGSRYGVSRQRIHQRAVRERARLTDALGTIGRDA